MRLAIGAIGLVLVGTLVGLFLWGGEPRSPLPAIELRPLPPAESGRASRERPPPLPARPREARGASPAPAPPPVPAGRSDDEGGDRDDRDDDDGDDREYGDDEDGDGDDDEADD